MPASSSPRAATLLLAVALAGGAAAGAAPQEAAPQEEASGGAVRRLGTPARILLSRLQVGWLAWLSAINGDDVEGARAAIARIQAYGIQVGMPHMPELGLAAAGRAVDAARAGRYDRARIALEGAEALDPGRPETAFAAAVVARADGAWGRWALETGRGYTRTLMDKRLRELLGLATLTWLHAVLLWALLAFAAVQMAVKGGWLYRDLLRGLSRLLPRLLAHPLIWLILVWPLALPAAPVWLALYWGVLLWGHSGPIERVAAVTTWVVLAVTPALATAQENRLELLSDPGLQVVEAAAAGRLYGSLLTEVSSLEGRLPASVALQHTVADLERRLGECEMARVFYSRVLEAEPRNAAALADLGLCSYQAGASERAIQYFQLAAESGRPLAQVQFNLSQAYSELYRFHEAESALRAARSIDSAAVNDWIQAADPRAMIPVEGGLERGSEIARLLRAGQRAPGPWARAAIAGRRLAILAVIFAAIALVTRYLLGADPRRPSRRAGRWLPDALDFWRRVLLPGIAEGELERWGRALLALVVVTALVTLPWAERIAFPVPWGIVPPGSIRDAIAVAGLGLLLLLRFLEQRNVRP